MRRQVKIMLAFFIVLGLFLGWHVIHQDIPVWKKWFYCVAMSGALAVVSFEDVFERRS